MYPNYFSNYGAYASHQFYSIRHYPQVNPNLLLQSAKQSKKLMYDASLVLNKLSVSKVFDSQLMNAAQKSDISEVNRLIHSIGVQSNVNVRYTPDGLFLDFTNKTQSLNCCHLTIALRWN